MAWLKWGVFFSYKTILFDLKMHDEVYVPRTFAFLENVDVSFANFERGC